MKNIKGNLIGLVILIGILSPMFITYYFLIWNK